MASASQIQSNNTISKGFNDANTFYNNIKHGLRYYEITEDSSQYATTLINVGPICNSETSNFSFNMTQYWDQDTMDTNVQNSEKISNDLEWAENSNFHNNTIKNQSGMLVNTIGSTGYIQDNVAFFNNIPNKNSANNIAPNINTISNQNGDGLACDIFGYFHPDFTGSWKFTLTKQNPNDNIYFWISNDHALYDYTAYNADICNNSVSIGQNQYQTSVNLTNGDYVPFRIQIFSKTATSYSNFFNVTPPPLPSQVDPAIGSQYSNPNSGWNYFTVFLNSDNTVYYKNLTYFGLVQSGTKFTCFFVQTSPDNVQSLLAYKPPINPILQYMKVSIDTTVTFAGIGTQDVQDGNPMNIDLPPGVHLNINNATYGLSSDWTYNKYNKVCSPSTKFVKAATTTTQLPLDDPYLPSKPYTSYVGAHTTPTTVYKKTATPVTETQHTDVTSQVQSIVDANGGNQFDINDPQANFLNPITNQKNPNINAAKDLTVQYSYSQKENTNVQNKQLYVDPSTALIMIRYTFYGQETTSPLNMDIAPTCSGDCSNYQMVLTTDAKLVVKDNGGNTVGQIDFASSIIANDPNFNINNLQVNQLWLHDPQAKKSFKAGQTLAGGKKLISSDGRFKLAFSNGELVLTYCYLPYKPAPNGVNYTTTFNVGGTSSTQILYLYRIATRGIIGRKFLQESDADSGKQILHYLPNNSNYILNMSQYTNPHGSQNIYPVFFNGALANSNNYNTATVSSQQECSNYCSNSSTCEHYFFVNNTNNSNTCYYDKSADSNPLYTNTNNNTAIRGSNFYKKNYTINSSGCRDTQDGLGLGYIPSSNPFMNAVTIDYKPSQNAPNLAYYCGLDTYIQANNAVKGAYKNIIGTPNLEGFDNTTVSGQISTSNQNVKQFSQTQDQIDEKYDQTLTKLEDYKMNLDKVADPAYTFSGSDSIIPDKYKNSPSAVPNITLQDGLQKDVNIMLLHQNTMNTLACITAATFLIIAIYIGRE